jgi:hypothetical protein
MSKRLRFDAVIARDELTHAARVLRLTVGAVQCDPYLDTQVKYDALVLAGKLSEAASQAGAVGNFLLPDNLHDKLETAKNEMLEKVEEAITDMVWAGVPVCRIRVKLVGPDPRPRLFVDDKVCATFEFSVANRCLRREEQPDLPCVPAPVS